MYLNKFLFSLVLLSLLLIELCHGQQQGQSNIRPDSTWVELSGYVYDSEDGSTIEGAIVNMPGTTLGSATNSAGYYSFLLPKGVHTILVKMIGMEDVYQKINLLGPGSLDFNLKESTLILEKVVIEAEAPDRNVREVVSGISRLSIEEIENITPFLGEVDVLKSLQTLPGISTVGEGSSGFNVRGGRADQNLILQNGSQLFNSSHVLGFFSSFNPDLIDKFTLYKGNIPAQFGGRVSSVLDVELREGSSERLQFRGGLGLVSSRLVLEGPLKNKKTTFLFGGRTSYSNYVLKRTKNQDVRNSEASFYDINAIISHRFSDNSKVILSYYGSDDSFRFSNEFGFKWNTQLGNLRWKYIINPDLYSNLTVVYGNYSSRLFEPEGADAQDLNNGIKYFQLKQNFLYTSLDKHSINAGVEWVHYDSKPETSDPFSSASGLISQVVDKEQGREISAYINDEFGISDRVSLSVGLRYSLFQNIGPYDVFVYDPNMPRTVSAITDTINYASGDVIKSYGGLEPRLSMRYQLTPSSSIKLSYSKMRQYIHSISNTTSPTPIDVWQVSNTYIPPQVADNFSLGYFKNYQNDTWETSFDLFYRDTDNLVEYKDLVQLLVNNHLETDLLSGRGRSYGAELSIKKTKGMWTGWLSYTYSRAEIRVDGNGRNEQINRGEWFASNYDKPHNITVVLKKQLGEKSAFNANFTYSTGRPTSAITSFYEIGTATIPQFSDRNQFRIPDYFRIDLSFTIAENVWKHRVGKDLSKRRYKDSLTISVYNLLARRNAYSVFFRIPDEFFLTPKPHKLSVLGQAFPALTYNFKF